MDLLYHIENEKKIKQLFCLMAIELTFLDFIKEWKNSKYITQLPEFHLLEPSLNIKINTKLKNVKESKKDEEEKEDTKKWKKDNEGKFCPSTAFWLPNFFHLGSLFQVELRFFVKLMVIWNFY